MRIRRPRRRPARPRRLRAGLAWCAAGAGLLALWPAVAGAAAPAGHGATYAVGVVTQTYVDHSRPTPAHAGLPALPSRTLVTTIGYPATGEPDGNPTPGAAPDRRHGPYPLIVFGHGLGATPQSYEAVLSRWAAAGFVVAAPAFPLTHTGTPGGVDQDDQVNQPADMRFVLTSVLAAPAAGGPLGGLVDPAEVGVAGHSDGAVTTMAFLNTCCVDPQVKAVEVLSGDPEVYPGGHYLTGGIPPTLIVHGTLDPLLPYDQMVTFYDQLHGTAAFLSLRGADHTDFLTPGPWFAATVAVTTDFWLAHLDHQPPAAARLPHDGQPPRSTVFTGAARVPLLPQPRTDRHATLSPSAGLVQGQTVTVRWHGYLPGKVVNVVECSSASESGCDIAAGKILVPDPTGSGTTTLRMVVGPVGDGVCDHAHPCQVVVNDAGLETPGASVRIPVTFAPS